MPDTFTYSDLGLQMPTIGLDLILTRPWSESPETVDISKWWWDISTEEGRQHELQQVEASTCSLHLDNRGGLFGPWNTNCPFYNILSLTDAGFVQKGTATPSLGNWQAVDGTISISVDGGYDAGPAMILTSAGSGDDIEANLYGTANGLYDCVGGNYYSACAAFKPVVGADARDCKVGIVWYDDTRTFISATLGTAVLEVADEFVKATVTGEAPSNATSFTVTVLVEASGSEGEQHLVARVGASQRWTDIITGTTIDNTAWGPGQLGITVARGLHVTATWGDPDDPDNTSDIFYGYMDSDVPTVYGELGEDCTISFSDGMNVLAQMLLTSQAYVNLVLGLDPKAYWRCNDPMGSTFAADSSGHGYNASASGQTLFGASGPFVYAVDTSVDLSALSTTPGAGGCLVVPDAAFPSSAGTVSVGMWFNTTDTGGLNMLFGGTGESEYTSGFGISWDGTQTAIYLLFQSTDFIGDGVSSNYTTTPLNNGEWHFVVVEAPVDTTPGDVKIYIDGKLFQTLGSYAWDSTEIQYWALGGLGNSSPIPFFDGSIAQGMIVPTAIDASNIAELFQIGSAGFAQSYSGQMIAQILEVAGVPSAFADLDTGNSECISPIQSQQVQPGSYPSVNTTTALQLIQQIVATEQGVFFQQPNGVFRFYERSYAQSNPTAVESNGTFANNPSTNLHYLASGFQPSLDQLDVWNDVPVQRTTIQAIGGLQVSYAQGVVQDYTDPTSIDEFGRRTNQTFTSVLLTDDTDCLYLSEYIVGIYAWPQTRVRSIQLSSTTASGATIVQQLRRGLIDAVTVIYKPQNNASTFTQQSQIEKISHKITQDRWDTTWMLTPYSFNTDSGWFILNDPTYGQLGGPGQDQSNKLAW